VVAKAKIAKRKMTKGEYRRILETLEIGVLEAGRVFGISRRQTIRYNNGETAIPDPVAKLMRLTIAQNLTAAEVKAV